MSNIKVRKLSDKNSCTVIPEGFYLHDPSLYIDQKKYGKYNGSGLKISVIGTGTPFHKDFANIQDYVNFSQDDTSEDRHGLSVQIAGILGANNPEDGITGLVFDSELYFAKALDDSGQGDINSLNASLLWSAVKDVDLIIVPFELPESEPILANALEKVKDQEICVFCHSKTTISNGVLKFGSNKKYNFWTTTAGVSGYIKPTSKIANIGVAAGILSLVIEKNKKSRRAYSVERVYEEFLGIV